MIELKDVSVSEDGCMVEYCYSLGNQAIKYFKKDNFFVEYSKNVSSVPFEILSIPFLVNVMPIAWFSDFIVKIPKMDETFYNALIDYKRELEKYYPSLKDRDLNLECSIFIDTVNNVEEKPKKAMLFSGGVDAYATYFRNKAEALDLITIHGADIKLNDEKLWLELKEYIESEVIIADEKKFYIKSNFREFITFEVDKLLPNLGWWGKIQHGIALTGLTAPLAYLNNYSHVFIASSYTRKPNYQFIVWGSMPETDNLIRWGETRIKHDAEKLTRQQKIEEIHKGVLLVKDNMSIRVCYSDYKEGVNCSVCEKCLRTIFGLMIIGANPNDYGFNVDKNIFKRLKNQVSKNFKSEGNQLFWKEIYLKALQTKSYFYFNDRLEEKQDYDKILKHLAVTTNSEIEEISSYTKLKLHIIQRLPILFNIYLKIRRKFIK